MTTNVATQFAAPCDPEDVKDYIAQFSDLLEAGEDIAAGFTVTPGAEAVAVGIGIKASPAAALAESNKSIRFWPEVDSSYWENEAFDKNGVTVPFEIKFNTTSSPQRTYERTFTITFKQL